MAEATTWTAERVVETLRKGGAVGLCSMAKVFEWAGASPANATMAAAAFDSSPGGGPYEFVAGWDLSPGDAQAMADALNGRGEAHR